MLADTYDVIEDNSVERQIDSNNVEYVYRRIRENYVTGSSCTVVLCGASTPGRKFVDWEIKATLDKEHGLIGVNLPSNPQTLTGHFTVADRLHDNIVSGYAVWTGWATVTSRPHDFANLIEIANARSKSLIGNEREMRFRNG